MKASAIFAALKTLIEAGRGEPQERRSAGCADAGAIGPDRSGVAISGEASQRAGASRSHDDSGAGRVAVATLNKTDAEEVAQEAVLKAFKSISAFGEKRGSVPG